RGEHLAAMRNHLGACRTYFHARVAGPESAAARREARRIPGVFASLATTQMRFPAATRPGTVALWVSQSAYERVARPYNSAAIVASSRLEPDPNRPPSRARK